MDNTNPNHNLWDNNGTWWCRYTVHYPDYTAERLAKSLETRDLPTARLRRNQLMLATPGARLPRYLRQQLRCAA